jgi:hypothetical protein
MFASEPSAHHAHSLNYSASSVLHQGFMAAYGNADSSARSSHKGVGMAIESRLTQPKSIKRSGDNKNNLLIGGQGDDQLWGGEGNDRLIGKNGADRLYGERGDDTLQGGSGNDILEGGSGRNKLFGEGGRDRLTGGNSDDILTGGADDDILIGNGGKDRLTGGRGSDQFIFGAKSGTTKISTATVITDFKLKEDLISLTDLSAEDLGLVQGQGKQAGDTLIQNKATGEYLLILKGMDDSKLSAADLLNTATPSPTSPDPNPGTSPLPGINAVGSVNANTAKFSPGASEATIAATGAASIKLGTQTLYIGAQQVSSTNQNPIIVSFDSSNPSNNWTQTSYEITGTDGRGYGLYWSGTNLYAVFSVDGTQGTPDQDFRRASSGATQQWLKSYGQGGGAKVAVLAKLNPTTGDMTDAVYLSALLSNGNSNSLAVTGVSVNAAGNLIVNAKSYFAPRRPDGQAMTQTSSGSSPFDYTAEITPDLKTVVNTSAVGWA